jgi:hypothetical protein
MGVQETRLAVSVESLDGFFERLSMVSPNRCTHLLNARTSNESYDRNGSILIRLHMSVLHGLMMITAIIDLERKFLNVYNIFDCHNCTTAN